MIKVSELVSKPLICLDTATIEGTIGNIVFDERLAAGKQLVIFCEDEETPEIKYVDLKKVTALKEDAGVVQNADSILFEWNNPVKATNPINCLCFNQDGKYLGRVCDIMLDGVKVEKIIVDNLEFTPKELLSYSDKLLIFNDSGKPIKLNKVKPKMPTLESVTGGSKQVQLHSEGDDGVKTLSVGNGESNAAPSSNAIEKQSNPFDRPASVIDVPAKILQDNTQVVHSPAPNTELENSYKFLIGKPVHSDILDAAGKIIIKAETIVSIETIRTARTNGKLVQLALRAY